MLSWFIISEGKCKFPSEWKGQYFQSGLGKLIHTRQPHHHQRFLHRPEQGLLPHWQQVGPTSLLTPTNSILKLWLSHLSDGMKTFDTTRWDVSFNAQNYSGVNSLVDLLDTRYWIILWSSHSSLGSVLYSSLNKLPRINEPLMSGNVLTVSGHYSEPCDLSDSFSRSLTL